MQNVVVRTFRKYPVLAAALTLLVAVEGVAIANQLINHAVAVPGGWTVDHIVTGLGERGQYNKCYYIRSADQCESRDVGSLAYNDQCQLTANGRKSTADITAYYAQACPSTTTTDMETIAHPSPLVNGASTIHN